MHVEKFTESEKAIFFRSKTKNNEVIAAKPFQNSGVTIGACGRLAVLIWRSSSIHVSSLWLLPLVYWSAEEKKKT